MTIVASAKTLLNKYTGQEDIVIGTPVAGRDHKDLENQIGIFVNNLPLRSRFTEEISFRELLKLVKKNTIEAYGHQVYPFDRLIDDLKLQRDLSRSPLFDVVVLLHDIEVEASHEIKSKQELSVDYFNTGYVSSLVDLRMIFETTPQGLNISFEYNTDLFTSERVERMLEHYKNLLQALTDDVDKPLKKLEYISSEERLLVEKVFNASYYAYPTGKTIVDLFEAQVSAQGDAVAVVFHDRTLSYNGLNHKANQLASYLGAECKLGPGDYVGVLADKSEQAIIAFLAILKSGCTYVPIDPSHPKERIKYIIEDTGIKVLLTQSEYLFSIDFYNGEIFAMDIQLEGLSGPGENHLVLGKSHAYVIYTSGSTGRPKGVLVGHEGLVNLSYDHKEKLGIRGSDHFLQFMSLSFDGSILDICVTLCAGATLVLINKGTMADREAFISYLEEKSVSIVALPPSYISILGHHPLPSVRVMVSAGEAAHVKDAVFYGNAKEFYNSYGPSEATVCATQYRVEKGKAYDRIPIGKPCHNKQVYILDKGLQLVGIGVSGEICIAGTGLALGYLNQEALTREKFIKNPYGEGKLYRTGDLGQWQADGNLEYLGRQDGQVKLRGFRIELGEIEEVMQSYKGIGQAVVVLKGEGSSAELAGYVQSQEEGIEKGLREHMLRYLPHYMVPSVLVRLANVPVNSNGKVDKRMLQAMAKEGAGRGEVYVAPRNQVEEKLARVWEEVLGIEKIGINDNFFEIGGNSLKIVQIFQMINEHYTNHVSVSKLFTYNTIRQQSDFIHEKLKLKNDEKGELTEIEF